MNRIIFDPGYEIQRVVLVGLGGTGSQLARSVCRMAYDRIQKRQSSFEIAFVDPDIVEIHNVGRQMFAPADVGQHKAELLASRFSRALGMRVGFFNDKFDPDFHLPDSSDDRQRTLLIGCVDNYMARRALSEAKCLTLDCGNHYDSGQVVLGNATWEEMEPFLHNTPDDNINSPLPAEWDALPYPYLIYPELLDEPDEDDNLSPTGDTLSCAELIERDTQHLLINEYVALAAAQYVYKLLHRQPITSYMTHVDSDLMTMKPHPISVDAIAHYNKEPVT
jgi:PRTRC genetic system ThiF family protein